jgi:hypothetical protein
MVLESCKVRSRVAAKAPIYIIFPPANSDHDLTSGGMPSFRGSLAFMHCAKRSAVYASNVSGIIVFTKENSNIPWAP